MSDPLGRDYSRLGFGSNEFWDRLFSGERWQNMPRRLVDLGVLNPPALKPVLTVASLIESTKHLIEDEPPRDEVLFALNLVEQQVPLDPDCLEKIFPFRSNADPALRRARLADWHDAYSRVNVHGLVTSDFFSILRSCCRCDYIMAMNMVSAVWVLGKEWWHNWMQLVPVINFENYTAVAKQVSNLLKMGDSELDVRFYAEAANLVGYRNPPIPSFDVVKETEALADGGAPHEYSYSFRQAVRDVLDKPTTHVEFVSFEDYVLSGVWATSGSSSEGHFSVNIDGKEEKFRAKKNILAEIANLEDLATRARASRRQVNKAIVKAELGKLRMAVSSDVLTYLKMHYVVHMMGLFYKKWPGSTSAESVYEQTDRNIEMLTYLKRRFGVPVDFAGFDHQPETDEIADIWDLFSEKALANTATAYIPEMREICASVRAGFFDSVLIEPSTQAVFRVTGGLMSGLLITSLVGNAWNTAQTARVYRWVFDRGLRPQLPEATKIKGDDTSLCDNRWEFCVAMVLGYKALNLKLGEGKFAVLYQRSEFLRVWYDTEGLHGYVCRAIPGINQRKPWASEPWDEVGTIRASWDALNTCIRRGARLALAAQWQQTLTERWAARTKLSGYFLQIPRMHGGLGVFPWDGKAVPVVRLPVVKKSFTPPSPNKWFVASVGEKLALSYPPVLPSTVSSVSVDLVRDTISADDIPAINRKLRQDWNRQIVGFQNSFRIVAASSDVLPIVPVNVTFLPLPGGLKNAERAAAALIPTFGKFATHEQRWKDLQVIKQYETLRPLDVMDGLVPGFAYAVRSLERRGLSRGNALDWLFGTLPDQLLCDIHPHLSRLLTNIAAYAVYVIHTRVRVSFSIILSRAFADARDLLRGSSTVSYLFRW